MLVLIRHGQSEWNAKNLFTGLANPPLSPKGEKEARQAGIMLNTRKIEFDLVFTSVLERAEKTCEIILAEMGKSNFTITKNKALNERDYGDLVGMNKEAAREKFGAEQVQKWRRDYETKPPGGESLKDTAERVLPYYKKNIKSFWLAENKNILIVAHGNSLRALIMFLENLTPAEIIKIEIPTGEPIIYQTNNGKIEKL